MKIKKISQTTPISAQVIDGYSESTKDTYSANYINKKMDKTSFVYDENTETLTITI